MTVVKNGKKEYRFQDKNGKFHTISINDDFAVWFEKKKISSNIINKLKNI